MVLIDGVKTLDAEGWTLVVPDPELPLTHVYAEARRRLPAPRTTSPSARASEIEALIS